MSQVRQSELTKLCLGSLPLCPRGDWCRLLPEYAARSEGFETRLHLAQSVLDQGLVIFALATGGAVNAQPMLILFVCQRHAVGHAGKHFANHF